MSLAEAGRTSFVLAFEVRSGGTVVATGRTVYVVVATDGTGKRPIPSVIGEALGLADRPA